MARVVLPFVKYKQVAQLPPVCIRCGKPATRTIQMQFKGRVTRVLGIRLYALGGGEDYVIADVSPAFVAALDDEDWTKGGAIPIGGAITDGQWHHVALVRQPDGTVELYLDGALQAKDRGASSGGPITTGLHTLGSDRFIVQAKQKRAAYFAGSIDEFCVFDRALPADDIAVLMGGKKG